MKNKVITKLIAEPGKEVCQSNGLKNILLSELKNGFIEAILISRGKMKGIPLSKLWEE